MLCSYSNTGSVGNRSEEETIVAAKILIIEDEAVIRRELKILLENAMYVKII